MKKFLSLAVFSAVFAIATATAASPETVSLGKRPALAARVLARFKVDTGAEARETVLTGQRARVAKEYSQVPGLVALELLPEPKPNLVVPGADKGGDPGKALLKRIAALQATGAFVYVEPDYMVRIQATPSDSAYQDGTLWGLNNTGLNGGVAGADIQAEEAWNITTGSPNVIVGVIDTGIRYTHQDLLARMWTNPGEIAGNGQDDDNDGFVDNVHGINAIIGSGNPMDDNDHGTHCAGTIGAQANGGGPHVGVAWDIRLMALKFLDAEGSGSTGDAVTCINFAVAEKGRLPANIRMILSNSWGGGGPSQALEDAVIAARNAGILFVAAAGNESNNNDTFPSYPANINVDNVLSVAAVDRADQLASFSNRGAATVHLGAPGVAIYSSTSGSDTEYKTFNGTSMATPHVSGVAALIWSAFPNASLSEVRQRLLVGVVPIQALNGQTVTGGRLNAFRSLSAGADGTLELAATAEGGLQVIPGAQVTVRVQVTDLSPVNNATVAGTLSTGGNVAFVNNGVAPDLTANDNIYAANITVPNGVASFSLNMNVAAPGKTPGSIALPFTVIQPPANDAFTQRTVITSVPALVTGSNENATAQPGEPDVLGVGGSSVWWSWTALQNGVAAVTTAGSNFDTLLGVYRGTSVNALTTVGVNDDVSGAYTSAVLFNVTQGTTYHFLVDGYLAAQGVIQLNLQLNPALPNDNFATRTPITGLDFTFFGYNLGATAEGAEPPHNGYFPFASVWWEWNNTSYTGPVYISTAGSTFDTHMAVYQGNAYGSLTPVANNDDVVFAVYLQSRVTFHAVAGTRYQIVVDSAGSQTGGIQLTLARAQENDEFYTPRILTGEFAQDVGFNLGATGQTGEAFYDPFTQNTKSVWWKWTAPRSGNVVVTTDGSPFDTYLEVYTGILVNDLSLVAYNDDQVFGRVFSSLVSFGAVQGVTYLFKVDGYYSESRDPFSGDLEWSWVDEGLINFQLSMDGRSQLGRPELRPDNTVALDLFGEPGRPYILAHTSNFNTWTPVATNTPVSRRLIFNQPINPAGNFYRAQPASLVGGE